MSTEKQQQQQQQQQQETAAAELSSVSSKGEKASTSDEQQQEINSQNVPSPLSPKSITPTNSPTTQLRVWVLPPRRHFKI